MAWVPVLEPEPVPEPVPVPVAVPEPVPVNKCCLEDDVVADADAVTGMRVTERETGVANKA